MKYTDTVDEVEKRAIVQPNWTEGGWVMNGVIVCDCVCGESSHKLFSHSHFY